MKKRYHNKCLYILLKPLLSLYFLIRYRYWAKAKKLPGKRGYIILAKRTSVIDPMLVQLAVRGKLAFANDDALFTKAQNLFLNRLSFDIAGFQKNDEMMIEEKLRNGVNICYFIDDLKDEQFEGKINEDQILFLKKFMAGIAVLNISGIKGVYPVYSVRPFILGNKIRAQFEKVLPFKSLVKIKDKDLSSTFTKALSDKQIKYNVKTERRAEYLERILYVCPKCHSLGSISTTKKIINCKTCDLKVEVKGDLTFSGSIYEHLSDWLMFQDFYFNNLVFPEDEIIFNDYEITLFDLGELRKQKTIVNGKLTLNKNKLHIHGKGTKVSFYIKEVSEIKVGCYNSIYLRFNEQRYLISGSKRFNAYKYVKAVNMLKKSLEDTTN